MSNTLQRILLFSFGIPALVAVVLLLPQFHHAAISLVITLVSVGSAREVAGLISSKGLPVKLFSGLLVGFLLPLLFWLATWIVLPPLSDGPIVLGVALLLILVLGPFAFSRADAIKDILPETLGLAFIALYPGLLSGMLILIGAGLPRSGEALLTLAFLTFGNDSAAWLAGVTLGRRRKLLPVSPSKSLEGFMGGLLASLAIPFAAALLFPSSLPFEPLRLLALGLLTGVAVIVGDLFESALKRSAGVKDSGNGVPGRGGLLDSVDSLLFAGPVFYILSLAFGFFS